MEKVVEVVTEILSILRSTQKSIDQESSATSHCARCGRDDIPERDGCFVTRIKSSATDALPYDSDATDVDIDYVDKHLRKERTQSEDTIEDSEISLGCMRNRKRAQTEDPKTQSRNVKACVSRTVITRSLARKK